MSAVVEFLTQGAGMVLGFLVALVPLIILHELGHMLTAKALGVWVREFGIGFPPRIMKLFQWQETEFTLNWLPLGGFALMEGEPALVESEIGEEKSPEQMEREFEARQYGLYAQSPVRRLPIFFSGPLMNIIAAWILAVALYIPGIQVIDTMQIRIGAVMPDSPAQLAGIQPGDVLVSIGGQPATDMEAVIEVITANLGVEMPLTVRRDNVDYDVRLTPRLNPPPGEGAMGIVLGNEILSQHVEKIPLHQSIALGTDVFVTTLKQVARLPVDLIRGVLPLETARPIGIINISRLSYETIQMSASSGTLFPILSLLMTVSLSLGIFNLLPIPALDGGHTLFTIVELVWHRAPTPAMQARINQVAMGLLLLVFVAITVMDILYPVSLLNP